MRQRHGRAYRRCGAPHSVINPVTFGEGRWTALRGTLRLLPVAALERQLHVGLDDVGQLRFVTSWTVLLAQAARAAWCLSR